MRMPGRHVARSASLARNKRPWLGRPVARMGRRTVILAVFSTFAALLPTAVVGASAASSPTGNPTLDATLAQATKLSDQIQTLSQQYDSLRIQLTQARAEAALARQNAARDLSVFAKDQNTIAAIAVENYMTGGLNPTLQLLTTNSPQSLLDRASIMTQLQRENGAKVNLVASAEAAAQRALAAAAQQQRRATHLTAQMQSKVAAIQQKENFFNSQAFAQAAAIYQKTGQYPNITVNGNGVGVQALKFALTRVGDPYVWGAAGPNSFDCSGLVMWAYAQVGISLLHFTGDQWNEGEHISKDQLAPGDLVFFFSDLSHVGMYVGNGLMIDASTFGVPVHVEPVFWSAYVGAVRIVA
jgi:cell wall-associated NlpC family hydrolase